MEMVAQCTDSLSGLRREKDKFYQAMSDGAWFSARMASAPFVGAVWTIPLADHLAVNSLDAQNRSLVVFLVEENWHRSTREGP